MSVGLRLRCDEGVLRIAAGAPEGVAATGRAPGAMSGALPGILDGLWPPCSIHGGLELRYGASGPVLEALSASSRLYGTAGDACRRP